MPYDPYVKWDKNDEARLRELRRIPKSQRTVSEQQEIKQLEEARNSVKRSHEKVGY